MGLDFLSSRGASRMRDYAEQPFMLDGDATLNKPDETVTLDIEVAHETWVARDTTPADIPRNWPLKPKRFIDGKDVGRTVAWLRSPQGYPIPVRLSEIGATVMYESGGKLKREFATTERVVSMVTDLFPWHEIEEFAIALQEHGYRLLACSPPRGIPVYDFERMRRATQNRSTDEMIRLEKQALNHGLPMPTLVDGPLEPRTSVLDHANTPVVGMIKTHGRDYLHEQGWKVFFNLQPGERTPAFHLQGRDFSVITWYLRLDGSNGEMPNWGVIRLEIPELFFNNGLGCDWSYLDRVSRLIREYRCHDQSYRRAAVSIYPIQRAEESLGALFSDGDALISHFYHLTCL
jgi:hypothetical protein